MNQRSKRMIRSANVHLLAFSAALTFACTAADPESKAWAIASQKNSVSAYTQYLHDFPASARKGEIISLIYQKSNEFSSLISSVASEKGLSVEGGILAEGTVSHGMQFGGLGSMTQHLFFTPETCAGSCPTPREKGSLGDELFTTKLTNFVNMDAKNGMVSYDMRDTARYRVIGLAVKAAGSSSRRIIAESIDLLTPAPSE